MSRGPLPIKAFLEQVDERLAGYSPDQLRAVVRQTDSGTANGRHAVA